MVGCADGRTGEGRIFSLTDRELVIDVALAAEPPSKIPVVLAVALMRPPVFRRVLQTAAAMGVSAIHVFNSCRVEKSFWQSTALDEADIRDQLILGLEQARDTLIPAVTFHKRFRPFAQDVLPGLLNGRCGIVADPSGGLLGLPAPGPKVLLIGPEGGFIPDELDAFRLAGCSVAGLGPRILRVETAVAAFLSRLL